MHLQPISLAVLAVLGAKPTAPQPTAPKMDPHLPPRAAVKEAKIKPLSKRELLTLGRDKGLTKSKDKSDVNRTIVDSADAVRNQVKLTTLCARETFVNPNGTGGIIFSPVLLRTCIEHGLPVGVRLVFPVEKHKGYIVNCGTSRLRWTIKRASLADPIQLSREATPTHTFVSQKTGTEIVEFLIPLHHFSHAIAPVVSQCQVAVVH